MNEVYDVVLEDCPDYRVGCTSLRYAEGDDIQFLSGVFEISSVDEENKTYFVRRKSN